MKKDVVCLFKSTVYRLHVTIPVRVYWVECGHLDSPDCKGAEIKFGVSISVKEHLKYCAIQMLFKPRILLK